VAKAKAKANKSQAKQLPPECGLCRVSFAGAELAPGDHVLATAVASSGCSGAKCRMLNTISCPDGLTKCSHMNQKQLHFLLGKCKG